MARYMYEVDGNIVKCTSTYARKPVVGIAKCNPVDIFDENIGKTLAKARCDLKVAEKRCKRANKKELENRLKMFKAQDIYASTMRYFMDALEERDALREQIIKLSISLS